MVHYVYILQSKKDDSYYVGSTGNLRQHIAQHNSGNAKYSSSKLPFKLVWFAGFKNKILALSFEKYLKSSSGFAFRNKHLL